MATPNISTTDHILAPATPAGLLFTENFSGSLPAASADAVSAVYSVSVPSNATKMQIQYNSTFTGAWSAVLTVFDPEGEERTSSLDACGTPEAGAMSTFTCTLKVAKPKADDWTLQLYWQVGEVTEDYTLDVSVWGYA